MLAFLSIGRHSHREQETVLDRELAGLLTATCLEEIRRAGLTPGGFVHLRSTDVSAYRAFGLPLAPFEHQERLPSEAEAIRGLLAERGDGAGQGHVLLLRPGLGWTPAPRIAQLAAEAEAAPGLRLSLLRQDAMQHVGWNMQVQDRSRLVGDMLAWAQSSLFSPRPMRREHPEIWDALGWPEAFAGSQHLPELHAYDGTMLALPLADVLAKTVPAEAEALRTARVCEYDEAAQAGRPPHERLRLFRLSASLPCHLGGAKEFLRLHVQSLSQAEDPAPAQRSVSL